MSGIRQLLIFVAGKVKCLVPEDRAAAVPARLLLIERRHLIGKEVRRITELVFPEIAEARRSHFVRAGLRDRVDHRAVDAPVLGVVPIGFYLELFDVFLAVPLVRAAAALVRHVHAVDLIFRHVAAGGAHLNGARIAACSGDERYQVEPVASVQRQILHLALFDGPRQFRLLGIDQGRFADDGNRFSDRRQLHREVENGRLANGQSYPFLDERHETGQLGPNRVGADGQRRHDIRAAGRCRGRPRRRRLDVCRDDGRTGQRGAALVEDAAPQLGLRHLRAGRHRRQREEEEREEGNPEVAAHTCSLGD